MVLTLWLGSVNVPAEASTIKFTPNIVTVPSIRSVHLSLESATRWVLKAAVRVAVFNVQDSLSQFESNFPQSTQKTPFNFYKTTGIVAAICTIAFLAMKLLSQTSCPESTQNQVAETKTLSLPDESEVNLSAESILQFDSSTCPKERVLGLEGKAFFRISTRNVFTVTTGYGSTQVLSTQFNVKSRAHEFEVIFYAGSVRVIINEKAYILQPKEAISFMKDKISNSKTSLSKPSWINHVSQFKSTSLESVLQEFNLYYDIQFEILDINSSRLYTRSFVHNDLENSLKLIILPLNLTYQINGDKVIFSNRWDF